jgi:uncharacterized protein (TIGR03435 family)
MVGMNVDAGMVRYSNVSLGQLIRTAFRMKEFQVDGPDWIGAARFDIVAKLPARSSQNHIPEMLQSLLVDRFKLAIHRGTREHTVYALEGGKDGPKLKPAKVSDGTLPDTGPDGNGSPHGAMSMQMGPEGVHLKASSATLSSVAEMISQFTDRPVLDMTGISGQYDFDLTFFPETIRGLPPGPPAPILPGGNEPAPSDSIVRRASIRESVERYGLRLELRKAPLETIIVDHVEKVPTEN